MEIEKLNEIQKQFSIKKNNAALKEDAKYYHDFMKVYSKRLRDENKLTHKGRPIQTAEDFCEVCVAEKWWDLLYNATQEAENYVRL